MHLQAEWLPKLAVPGCIVARTWGFGWWLGHCPECGLLKGSICTFSAGRDDVRTLLCLPFCFGTASLLAAVWSIQQIASQLSSSQARAKARHRDGLCHLPSLSVVFSQHVLQALPQHGDGPEPRQASPPHRLPQTDQAGPWKAAKSTKGSRGRKEREKPGDFLILPLPLPLPPSLPPPSLQAV